MTEIKRQLPNFLTLIRIPLALLCGYFALTLKPFPLTISLLFFMAASFTDFLDGYLARRWNTVSKFGKITDPIADKILIIMVLCIFSYHSIIPLVFTILIAVREIALTVIRLILLFRDKVTLAARYSGKVKTFTQSIVLFIIYNLLIFKEPLIGIIGNTAISVIIFSMIVWTVLITLYSGYETVMANKRAIEGLI